MKHKDGDIVTIAETPEDFDKLPDEVKRSIKYIYRDPENDTVYIHFPIKVKCVPVRINRTMGHLCVEWLDARDETWKVTNVYTLEKAGFEFEHPHFEILGIMEADEDLLSEYELVIRSLVENGYSIGKAAKKVEEISEAMHQKGIVFYRP